jgi:hypothetical protein
VTQSKKHSQSQIAASAAMACALAVAELCSVQSRVQARDEHPARLEQRVTVQQPLPAVSGPTANPDRKSAAAEAKAARAEKKKAAAADRAARREEKLAKRSAAKKPGRDADKPGAKPSSDDGAGSDDPLEGL